jgi:uncharacterized protein (TIGR00251 family)
MTEVTGAIEAARGGVRLLLTVQPRASKTAVVGLHDNRLKIRLAAPPVDGAANEALIVFLAREMDVSRTAVRILAGERGRRKTVLVQGVSLEKAKQVLGG